MFQSSKRKTSHHTPAKRTPSLRALKLTSTATQTQSNSGMPTQAAVQLAASRPQNQVYPLAVDEFTTNEQAAAPIPTIAPSIPLTVSGEYPLISIFDKGSRP